MLNKHSDGKSSLIQKKIENIALKCTGSNKAEVQKWMHNGTVKDISTNLKKVLYVRTILTKKDEQNLLDFYYPSSIKLENQHLTIENVSESAIEQPALLIGTVGQGKSISLRYLSFYELCKTERIPVFLELRKLRSSTPLTTHIQNFLEKVKLTCSEKLVQFLLANGFISLLLDGFDELKHEKRQHWVNEIENVITKYKKTKVVVTTRPNTDIHQHHIFKNYELKQLDEADRANFIKKLVKNTEDQNALIGKLSNAGSGVTDLLTTPLLMALFVSVYNNRRKLPNSNSEFFDELFSTLLSRHDGLKVAYDRPTKSGFTDKELKAALQSLCYQTRKASFRQISDIQLNDIATLALNAINLDSKKSESFIYDVSNITCLLLKDGLEYRFIHDSVQEYYSASFVRDQEEAKEKFYSKYLTDWHHWSPELNFLMYIDPVGYNKYFFVPSVKLLCDVNDENEIIRFKKSSFIDLLLVTDIIFLEDKEKGEDLKFLLLATKEYVSNWASDLICKFELDFEQNSFRRSIEKTVKQNFTNGQKLAKYVDKKKISETFKVNSVTFFIFQAHEFLSDANFIDQLYESIDDDALYDLIKGLNNSLNFIKSKKDIGNVF
ncbi:NACHT domain-containing protein [Thalassotalea euphylliae]|uniref:NACHT domain-containing protein n=1 Tax=Thalassotalea euphylliae TaxID=1655234 RepID=UPI0011C03015|nr:NACHT domain-containing protein [Thalassotalea euphylliae]